MKKGYNKETPGACIIYHGLSKVPEHGIWRGILQRCYNPKRKKYAIYGAKGIMVCPEWLEEEGKGFMQFLKDMGNRPTKEHSIERVDNSGNYCKENCKWATKKEQARNRTTSRLLEYKGETKALAEWVELLSLNYAATIARLNTGWSVEKAIETPVRKINKSHKTKNVCQ